MYQGTETIADLVAENGGNNPEKKTATVGAARKIYMQTPLQSIADPYEYYEIR